VNRRNVTNEVDKNFSACKQFFRMEIEARVVAAALDCMGMTCIEDTPPENILPPSLVKATVEVQRKFLRDLVFRVVDTYIVNEKNIDAHIEELEQESKFNEGRLPDGRFGCRFPGCKKSFANNGKRRFLHEKTHGLHPNVKRPTHSITVKDDVLNYQLALLEYGMLYLNFCDAVSEGDGLRILRCWKFFLMFLKADGARSRKYAVEGLHLLSQYYAILSPRDAHRLIWNRFIKAKHGLGGNIPLDLALEHYNRVLKEVIKKMGPNASNQKAVNRFCKCISVTKELIDNFDHDCAVLKQSGKHIQKKCTIDLKKIVNELLAHNVFTCTEGRVYKYFNGCSPSILQRFSLHDAFKWINEHKKNIILKKTAR
jgi:hypothetical protein